jgi:IS30 family transposase
MKNQQTKVTENDKSRWVTMYKKGASIRTIAAEYGRAYTTVHGVLYRARVLRTRQEAQKKEYTTPST